jgi:hypothetical protein
MKGVAGRELPQKIYEIKKKRKRKKGVREMCTTTH